MQSRKGCHRDIKCLVEIPIAATVFGKIALSNGNRRISDVQVTIKLVNADGFAHEHQ